MASRDSPSPQSVQESSLCNRMQKLRTQLNPLGGVPLPRHKNTSEQRKRWWQPIRQATVKTAASLHVPSTKCTNVFSRSISTDETGHYLLVWSTFFVSKCVMSVALVLCKIQLTFACLLSCTHSVLVWKNEQASSNVWRLFMRYTLLSSHTHNHRNY